MKLRQSIITILLLKFCNIVNAQQISSQILNSGGQSSSNGGAIVEYSLGGFLVNTINTPSFMYTQDFLQPDAGVTNVPPFINDVKLDGFIGLDNAGTTFVAGGNMVEFTVGEVASITLNNTNNMLTQGILQPYPLAIPLPVLGLDFYAKRLNNTTVQLNWKTLQEINNKGFHIERKKENEHVFANLGFINSKADNGNSSLPLEYEKLDENNYAGYTYYRLKQEDIDDKFIYSIVRMVKGEMSNHVTMKAWPIPSNGYVNVLVDGIQKPESIDLLDINGRTIKSYTMYNQQEQRVDLSGLASGIYFVKLKSDESLLQKIVVE